MCLSRKTAFFSRLLGSGCQYRPAFCPCGLNVRAFLKALAVLFRCVPQCATQRVAWVLDCGLWHGSVLKASDTRPGVRSRLSSAGGSLGVISNFMRLLPELLPLHGLLSISGPLGLFFSASSHKAGALLVTRSATHLLQLSLCVGLNGRRKATSI